MPGKSGTIARIALVLALSLVLATGAARYLKADVGTLASDVLPEKAQLAYEPYEVDSLPAWFEESLFSSAEASELYASESDGVYGLIMNAPVVDVFSSICKSMEDRGWLRVESGLDYCSTFLRESGAPSWALVSCTPVGNATSVVVSAKGGV